LVARARVLGILNFIAFSEDLNE